MSTGLIVGIVVVVIIVVLIGWGVSAYNNLVTLKNRVKNGWAQIDVQLKQRADLIPNLVNTVKGYAAHEQQVLTAVTQARAKVGQVKVNADDAASLAQFQAAQGELSSALSRLLVVSENYPQLKADASFLNLQTQLEGTENRITVARGRYIQLVQDYNTYIRSFPQNLVAMVFGYKPKPNFTVENEAQIQDAPSVDFAAPAPPVPPVSPAATNG